MIPISNELKTALLGDTLAFQNLDITVELRDNNVITLDNDDIYQGSFNIDRSVASGGKIEIGSAVASECNIKLVNDEGQFNSYNFLGAVITVVVNINNEDAPLGVFTVDEVRKEIGAVNLVALDKMVEFDRLIAIEDEKTFFPKSVNELASWCCEQCNVDLAESISSLPNGNYSVKGINDQIDLEYKTADGDPEGVITYDWSQITYRNLLQYIGQLTGTCCYMDWEGKLRFSWFTESGTVLDTDNRFSSDIDEQPITITGVAIKHGEEFYTSGDNGYVLSIADNKLLSITETEENLQLLVTNLGNALNGFTYYPFSASILPLIYLLPLDKLTYKDKDNNSYPIIITGTNYVVNSAIAVEGVGESQVQHWYADNSGMTNQISTETKNAINDLKTYIESLVGNFNKVVVGNVKGIATGNDALLKQWASKNDATLIDGGKIYTKSISAEQINVDDLSALNATVGGWHITDDFIFAIGNKHTDYTVGASSYVWDAVNHTVVPTSFVQRFIADNWDFIKLDKNGTVSVGLTLKEDEVDPVLSRGIVMNSNWLYNKTGYISPSAIDTGDITSEQIRSVSGWFGTVQAHNIYENGSNLENKYIQASKVTSVEPTGSNTISVPANTIKEIARFTVDAGIYMIHVGINFAANANGVRRLYVADSDTNVESTSGTGFRIWRDSENASSNGSTQIHMTRTVSVNKSTTYIIYGMHTASGSINTTCTYEYIGIKS